MPESTPFQIELNATKESQLVQFKVPNLIYDALDFASKNQAQQDGLLSLYLRLVVKDFYNAYEPFFKAIIYKSPIDNSQIDYTHLPNHGVSDEHYSRIMNSISSTNPLRKRSFPSLYLNVARLIGKYLGEYKPDHIMFRNLTLRIIISQLNIQ